MIEYVVLASSVQSYGTMFRVNDSFFLQKVKMFGKSLKHFCLSGMYFMELMLTLCYRCNMNCVNSIDTGHYMAVVCL